MHWRSVLLSIGPFPKSGCRRKRQRKGGRYSHTVHFAAVERRGGWSPQLHLLAGSLCTTGSDCYSGAPGWQGQKRHMLRTPPSPSPHLPWFLAWLLLILPRYVVLEGVFPKISLENVEGSTLLERFREFLNYYILSWILKLLYRSDKIPTDVRR